LSGCIGVRARPNLKDEFDDFLGHEIGHTKVGAGDRDEAEDHRRRLRDLTTVGPLDAL
jgi:hypothetical protein